MRFEKTYIVFNHERNRYEEYITIMHYEPGHQFEGTAWGEPRTYTVMELIKDRRSLKRKLREYNSK